MKKQSTDFNRSLVAELIEHKADNSIIIANRKGEIEWVNSGFIRMTGYSLKEVYGTNAEILRMGASTGLSDQKLLDECIKNRESKKYEVVNFTKDGEQYWVSTTITPCFDEETKEFTNFLVIESDITERMNMELDLRYSKGMAEEAKQAQEMFLANMSHEIRTPMNAILGFAELLQKSDLDEEQRDFVETIRHSGENLLVLINDILDFSRISSGKITFEKKEFNVAELAKSVVKTLQLKAQEQKNNLRLDCSVSDINVIGDPTRLKQILINLVNNALKFTNEGDVKLSIDVVHASEGMTVEFTVADSGIGIEPDQLEFIFERFHQLEDFSMYGGTGLGLPIVKSLVDMQGGKIWVESSVGVGSEFTFAIPYEKATTVPEKQTEPEADVATVWINKKVLLVEDNIINQKFAKRLLADHGLQVTVASNGEEALMACKREPFELILMDIQMPVMDGYETTTRIRSEIDWGATVPIIAMTAHATQGVYQTCIKAGATDYISKPVNGDNLVKLIMKYCDWELNAMASMPKPKQTRGLTDLSLITESAGEDYDYIIDILKSLIREIETFNGEMELNVRTEAWSLVGSMCHKMQSAAQLMGTTKIVEHLAKVEGFAKDPFNQKNIPPLCTEIRTRFAEAVIELEQEIFNYEKRMLQRNVN